MWGIACAAHWKLADVSEEHVTFIFRVKEWAKQETNMKQVLTFLQIIWCYVSTDKTLNNF